MSHQQFYETVQREEEALEGQAATHDSGATRKSMKSIAQAFVKAQKEFGPALKSASNPHFKTKYADLAACVEAVIEALNNNGIALIQRQHESDSGVTVETVFLHESGEMLESGRLHVPAVKNDPQAYGSALTYARRYSLMAACGIAPEDDDGNATKKPDITAILAGITGSATVDVLRANFEAAMQMLPEAYHPAVQKATATRKAELKAATKKAQEETA